MTELPYEPDAPIGDYGRWRNARWLAGMQARADDMTQAAMQAHGQSEARRQVQAGQAGLYGHQTPYDRGFVNQVGGPPAADAVSPTMAWQRGQR